VTKVLDMSESKFSGIGCGVCRVGPCNVTVNYGNFKNGNKHVINGL